MQYCCKKLAFNAIQDRNKMKKYQHQATVSIKYKLTDPSIELAKKYWSSNWRDTKLVSSSQKKLQKIACQYQKNSIQEISKSNRPVAWQKWLTKI